MNIAIVGGTGYIAKNLINRLKNNTTDNIFPINHIDLDLQYPDKYDYSKLNNIDYVVFTAAISSPDKCTNEFDFCWNINVKGTIYFINEAIKRNCKVIFFSSDAVYGDISGYVYTEKSETKAITSYGKMKKAVEDEFLNNNCFKSLRLSYVVSKGDKFTSYCLNCIKEKQIAEIFHPFYRSCVVLSDVLSSVEWLLNNWDKSEFSVLNLCGKELVSRIRIADEINRFMNNSLNYKIITPNEEFYNNRPKITQIESLYLEKLDFFKNTAFSKKFEKELGEKN